MSSAASVKSATSRRRGTPVVAGGGEHRDFAAAVTVHAEGRLYEAETLYRELLARVPDHAESWSNLSLILVSRGEYPEAVAACHRALALRPDYPEAHYNLIAALEGAGRPEEALTIYRRALAIAPQRPDLRSNCAILLEALGRLEEARELHAEAAALEPGSARFRFNLGRAATLLGRPEEAVNAYRGALEIAPDMVEALSGLATALVALGRHAEAAEAGRRAQALQPGDADVANNCAVVLQQGGRTAEAVEMYRVALAANPSHAGAWANLGIAFQELFRFDDAVEAFERAIAANPEFHSAVVEAIKIRRHICDWSRYAEDEAQLLDLVDRETDAVFMLLLMAFPASAERQHACARHHMARLNASPARIGPHPRPVLSGRLRVGYSSHDYREHPVGRLLPEMLAQHDRRAFEVFAYALGPDDPGRVRRRILRACDHVVDLHGMSDRAAAQRIYDDRIDVLVDLTGPTTGARLDILALRPAPVQVSLLGWPGTTGLDCIDYVIGDALLTPADHQPFFSERIVQLPHCYQPSDPYRGVAVPDLTRADCGLPEAGFVFCSFNNTLKLTPDLFDLWLRLLAGVEGSVLWLYCKTPRTMANLRGWAEMRGIAPERIVFAPVAGMDAYLGRLRLADLFLDSHPYTAGATCNDALWMGLPVLTCAGDTYVSRMASSLLRAANLPDLITTSLADYQALALRLASEPEAMEAVRRRLSHGRGTAPLFDMPRFTAALEGAYQHMRFVAQAGRAPEGFAIGDPGA